MHADVLAVGAHPDDIELSCGGTIAKLVKQERRVVLVDLTQGELGTRGTKEIRAREAAEANRILGALERRNLKIPDGNIEVNKRNLLKLVTLIREFRPTLMIIPHSIERHPDHVHAHQLCKEAWFYAGLTKIVTRQKGRRQEPYRPDTYFEFMQWYEFTPSFIVDVSDTMETKMAAIRAHASQFHNPLSREPETKLSRPEFLELIEVESRYYGHRIGVTYGEGFFAHAPIGVTDLFSIITHKK